MKDNYKLTLAQRGMILWRKMELRRLMVSAEMCIIKKTICKRAVGRTMFLIEMRIAPVMVTYHSVDFIEVYII